MLLSDVEADGRRYEKQTVVEQHVVRRRGRSTLPIQSSVFARRENMLTIENASNDTLAMDKQLQQFAREVRVLLKSQPQCTLPFEKFIPTYHNHFGRQCSVVKYGQTRLVDLLESVSHVVQILGSERLLTLTHREQLKRFVSDLVRVLTSQEGKRIKLSHFAPAYQAVMQRTFDVSDYGMCFIEDLLEEVAESTLLVSYDRDEKTVEIPQKVRTAQEVQRTVLFAQEVVKLLSDTPTLSMPFSKFIPAYHQHFTRQCKVSDYGFTKLIELFEAITSTTIEIRVTHDNEKLILLSKHLKAKVLAMRLTSIQLNRNNKCNNYAQLLDFYRQKFGHSMTFDDFNLEDLIRISKTASSDGQLKLIVQQHYKRSHRNNYVGFSVPLPLPPANWTKSLAPSPIDSSMAKPASQSCDTSIDIGTIDRPSTPKNKTVSSRMAANFDCQLPFY